MEEHIMYTKTTCDLCKSEVTPDEGGGIHKGHIEFIHDHHVMHGGRTDKKQFDICNKCLPEILKVLPLHKGVDLD